MERAEQRQRRHGSARLPVRPAADLVRSAVLLAFAFGTALCGVQEAAADRHWVWMGAFIAGAVVMVALYCWVVLAWTRLVI